ncbi:RNA-directed DNA polymerase from mobile element jockey-like protein [Willisornis vidua]|uniref:RNA-directed DNA polymerase from mobile element jockey-like protein n=1 Tax=Willisornis vidua TaxID=1566151 RepID=A0ABQ9DPQ7_9PASS|nr:RNA-directed DNA polymerase from mobile element jockey-like protein [Willisornis vidua]
MSKDWKKDNVIPIYKGLKGDAGNFMPIRLPSVPGKVMEQILLEAVTSQMKHIIGKSQHGSTKDKWFLVNLITFCDEATCLADVGQAVDAVYPYFSKAFDTVSHGLLSEKLMP